MSDEKNDSISRSLGLTNLDTNRSSSVIDSMRIDSHDDSAVKDFEFVHANIIDIIDEGKLSLQRLAELADKSQHPRAFEVLAKFIDTLVNANKSLLDAQTKIREFKDPNAKISQQRAGPHTVNQTVAFFGTTTELQRAIKGAMHSISEEDNKES